MFRVLRVRAPMHPCSCTHAGPYQAPAGRRSPGNVQPLHVRGESVESIEGDAAGQLNKDMLAALDLADHDHAHHKPGSNHCAVVPQAGGTQAAPMTTAQPGRRQGGWGDGWVGGRKVGWGSGGRVGGREALLELVWGLLYQCFMPPQ